MKGRIWAADFLRGVAIWLMVIDHLLILGDFPDWLRFGPTRLCMPVFALLAGYFSFPSISWSRVRDIASWGLFCSFLGVFIGIGQPDILLLLAFGFLVLKLWPASWPAWWLLPLCFFQVSSFYLPWPSFQPGVVLGFMVLGRMFDLRPLFRFQDSVYAWRSDWMPLLAIVGRSPLEWYVYHLVGLSLLKFYTL